MSTITINNEKAIPLAQERIRRWREKEFAKNDVDSQDAILENNNAKKATALSRRDHLRDLPAQCEGKTVAELESLLETEMGAEWREQ